MEMKKVFVFLAALLFTWTGSVEAQDNQLTAKEKKEGWVLLFNGKNLRIYQHFFEFLFCYTQYKKGKECRSQPIRIFIIACI